jgi:hypothetical protein
VDELERGSPFQQRNEEPSAESDVEKSADGGEQPSPQPDNGDVDPGSQVMGRLPRTRPQRRSGRRPGNAVKSTPSATSKRKPATRSRPRASGATRSSGSSASRARTTGAQARRRPAETATRAAARKRAPGIPRLAAGAAVGAAMLPLKVTASVARQATKLIGRGVRLR